MSDSSIIKFEVNKLGQLEDFVNTNALHCS